MWRPKHNKTKINCGSGGCNCSCLEWLPQLGSMIAGSKCNSNNVLDICGAVPNKKMRFSCRKSTQRTRRFGELKKIQGTACGLLNLKVDGARYPKGGTGQVHMDTSVRT